MKTKSFKLLAMVFPKMRYVYPVSEDTLLMWETIKNKIKKHEKILEIGTGSGFIAKQIQKNGNYVVSTDINPDARAEGVTFILSDLFDNINNLPKFDVIIFNPPYLRNDNQEDKWNKLATIGGKKGHETIENFLKDAKQYGKRIYLLYSSLTGDIRKIAKNFEYSFKIIAEKKLFFEKLFVAELISLQRSL